MCERGKMVILAPIKKNNDCRFRDIRESLGLSHEEMSKILKVTVKDLKSLENGHIKPNELQFEQMGKMYEVKDLGEDVYSLHDLRKFLRIRLDSFQGLTGCQLLIKGDYETVLQELASDYEGMGA